jgi:hypothetical protein
MKLAKMSGGAKVSILSAVMIGVATIALTVYRKCEKNILLMLGLFAVFFGITEDLAGSLITASVFTAIYVLSRKGVEGFADAEEKPTEKKNPPPDHGDRAEMFELGKKYKMPGEKDDSEFHLDAGTTFMNAYKALKPEQVAAMTKDTQELMETQKQLMSTLQTLKPLISDGKQMMEMFQSYFGSGNPTPN